MKKTIALISVAALMSAQAVPALAASDSARVQERAVSNCSPVKVGKVQKIRVNACQNDISNPTPAYVFAGALVAGAIAIAVSTTNHHNNTASP